MPGVQGKINSLQKPEGINLVNKRGLPLVPGTSNNKEIAEKLEPGEAKKDPDFLVQQ